jgi:tetratricopeptide (TPR) repeat protein
MDNTDYIESYFTNELIPQQAREFETRIESDPAFAEEVAFYLSTLNISREVSQSEKKEQFKIIYRDNKTGNQGLIRNIPVTHPSRNASGKALVRKLVYYIATAAVITGIIFGVYTFTNNVSPQQKASRYEKEKLQTLGVNMGGKSNSMQTGLDLYNKGKTAEALLQFERIIQSDTTNFTAKENAGLAALRLKKYDKALAWFKELESYSANYANPALFDQALTLMNRNQPGDNEKAKQLLQRVVQNDGQEKETAQEWLRNW